MPVEGGGGGGKGPDTSGTLASAHTVPSDRHLDAVASADTVLSVPPAEPSSPSMRGDLLGGRYKILAEVGRGAEGVVYRARDLKADTVVALKLLQQDEDSDERLQRFRRELQMARKVTHPNVVRIYDLVELPGRFGLSMEIVDGEALDHRIARGKLGREEVVRLALDLARALAAAHEAGVTHRDLKPGNVLLRKRDGHAMVTDFGVSRAHVDASDDARISSRPDPKPLALTREGAIIGTPQYMSPEQLEGHADVGPAADVYAFGAVVFEAATGDLLHEAQTLGELRKLRGDAPAPRLRDRRPDLPRRLCDAVDRALERQARDRFRSGVELLAAIEPLAAPPGKARRAYLLGGAAMVVALGGTALLARRLGPTSVHATPPGPTAASPATPPLVLNVANPRRVTFGDACEEFPSFTPDGRSVVYDGTVGRDSFVYRLDVESGAAPQQLTRVRGWDIAASIAPQGDRIAFLRFEGERVGAWVAPLDGHEPPRMVVRGGVRPSWTRDGTAIWSGAGAPLAAYDAGSGALVRTLQGAPALRTAMTVELSDGSLVAAMLHQVNDAGVGGIAVFAQDRPPRWLLEATVSEVLAVTPDERHVLAARPTPTGVELIDVPLDGSPVTSLAPSGVEARQGVALSRDGTHLVWSACREVPELVSIDARGRTPRALGGDLPGPSSLAFIPGTSELVVVSVRTGKREPWIVPLSGDAPPRAIPMGDATVGEIAVSHDGTRFVASVPGKGLRIGSLRGDPALRAITDDPLDGSPAFRAGDASVVFSRRRPDGTTQIMEVPSEGGATNALVGGGSDGAAPSPVDERMAYLAGATPAEVVPTVWDGRAGTLRPLSPKLTPGRYAYLRFSPDGKRVALVRGDSEMMEVDAASGAIVRTFATPNEDQLFQPTYTPSGLVVVRVRWQGNLWMGDVSNNQRPR
jgi:tRNA A-37 threonylcarbamoyl transferase component Bud32/dipeptidyl aminopeptidase/acylaminoacyl peptidase